MSESKNPSIKHRTGNEATRHAPDGPVLKDGILYKSALTEGNSARKSGGKQSPLTAALILNSILYPNRKERLNRSEIALVSGLLDACLGDRINRCNRIDIRSRPDSVVVNVEFERNSSGISQSMQLDVSDLVINPLLSSEVSDDKANIRDNYYKIYIDNLRIYALRIPSDSMNDPASTFAKSTSSKPRGAYRAADQRPDPSQAANAEVNRNKQQLKLRLRPALIEAITQSAAESGQSRNDWIEEVLLAAVQKPTP